MSLIDGLNSSLNNTKTQEIGIGGFRLFAKIDESVNYTNVVPINVLEDGTNSTDDIINNPISVSMTGNVGDLFVENRNFQTVVGRDFSQVGEVVELLPPKSQQQIQRISQIDSSLREAILIKERAERIGNKAYDFINNSSSVAKPPQEQFIEYMEAVYFGRQPIDISTTYRDYSNMALEDLTIFSNNQDGGVGFTARFTQIQFSKTIFVPIEANYDSPSQSWEGKTSNEAQKGSQNPETNSERSLLSSLIGG